MPAWIPLLKAALPYVAQIVTTAIPVFTSRAPAKGASDEVIGKQIAELQDAVTQNAESVHTLASKLQDTLQGIDLAATTLQGQLESMRRMARGALAVAIAALGVACWALTRG